MAFSKLFKSKPQADPRIRWFGKLPTYGDYYRSPADADWAGEFNEWIMSGFELYQNRGRSATQPLKRLPIAAVVLRLPQSEMTVFASILDYGGDMRNRPFPMCFYVAVPTAQWPGPTSSHVPAAARAVRDLVSLRRDVGHFLNSPGRFESTFANQTIPLSEVTASTLDESWRTEGRALEFTNWMAAASAGIKIEDPALWTMASLRWGERIARFDGKEFEPTLRFPLAMRLPLDVQIAGWIHWLERRMKLRGRMLSLAVVGDLDRESGSLIVIARAPVKDDFLLLTPLGTSLSYVDDVGAMTPAADLAASDSLPQTWLDFVER